MQPLGAGPVGLVDIVDHQRIGAGGAHIEGARAGPARDHAAQFAVGEMHGDDPLVLDFGADRRMAGGRRTHRRDVAAEIAQGVELVHADLAQGAAGRALRIPAPVLARQPQAAVIGEIGLDLAELAELSAVDRLADGATCR